MLISTFSCNKVFVSHLYRSSQAKRKALLLFIALSSVLCAQLIFAGPVMVEPIKKYCPVGDCGKKYASIQELIADRNAVRDSIYEACRASNVNSCSKVHWVNPTPSDILGYTNGEANHYSVDREATNWGKTSGENTTYTPNSFGIYMQLSCPKGMSGWQQKGDENNIIFYCTMIEKNSCAVEGNPINVGTGNKVETVVDYQSADKLLTVTRHYLNQNQGWNIEGAPRLIDLTDIISSPVCYPAVATFIHIDQQNTSSTIRLQKRICLKYHSTTQTANEVFIRLANGSHHRFIKESSGVYSSAGMAAAKTKLERLSPAQNDIHWRWTLSNSTYYFDSDGLLKHILYSSGRSVYYTYSNGQLATVEDDAGRSLSYTYANGNISSITLPNTSQIEYQYGESDGNDFLQTVLMPDGTSRSYFYNEPGLVASNAIDIYALTGLIDENGNRVGTYQYNSSGKAISTEGYNGTNKYQFTFNTTTTTVVDPLGATYIYRFQDESDGTRLLTKLNQPAGSGCAASYSETVYSNGLPSRSFDFNRHRTNYLYDQSRKLEVIRVEGLATADNADYFSVGALMPAGTRKISTEWHPIYRKASRIAGPNKITTYVYHGQSDPFNSNDIASCAPLIDGQPLLLLCKKVEQATLDGNGSYGFSAALNQNAAIREWRYTYNAKGKILTVHEPGRDVLGTPTYSYEYYPTASQQWRAGDLQKVINAAGHFIEYLSYNSSGFPLRIVDQNGIETTLAYDVRDRLTSMVVDGKTTTWTHNLVGDIASVIQPSGAAINYHYDDAHRLIGISDNEGNQIEYTLDAAGNRINEKIVDASNQLLYQHQQHFDALARLQNLINTQQNTTTYLYDPNGNLTGTEDANENLTNQVYDKLGRLHKAIDPAQNETVFTYNAQGQIDTVTDAKGLVTTYHYDAFGNLTSLISPDTGTTTFTYDNAGNRTSATDSRGVVVNYTYDALNRLTGIEYPASPTENITYTYDGTINGNHGIGRLTGISSATGSIQYTYTPQGLVTAKQVTLNNQTRTTAYNYDAAGQLTGITYPSGRIVTYTRDTAGRISGMTTRASSGATEYALLSNLQYLPFGPANAYTYGNGLTLNHDYDQDYRLQGIEVSGINPVLERDYSYDPVNNITAIINPLNTGKNQSFGYDALNRLTSAQGIYGLLGYTYDAVGNRLTHSHDDGTALHHDTYSYATDSHRLLGISRLTDNQPDGNRSFTYDNTGNRLTGTSEDGSTHTHTYNHANRMDSVSVDSTAAATYTYNPLGQRVSKTTNNTQEIYYYDEAGQLISVTDANGNPQREYIYFNNQPVAFIANSTIYYIHTDHLNTPQVVTDQNQQVVWMGDYQPFGKLTDTNSETNSIELYSRFPGQYLDSETGLYYNYFRDYDPSIGRYIQSDPIGLNGGMNTYAYVGGNPHKYSDPLGLVYGLGGGPYSQVNLVSALAKEDTFSPNSECVMKCKVVSTPVCLSIGTAGASFTAGIGIGAGFICNVTSSLVCKSECDNICPKE